VADEDETFFGAIGRLTLAWGRVEIALDVLVYEAFYRHHALLDPEPPMSLKRKIKYLRKAFRVVPKFTPYNDRFIKIADSVMQESKTRHDIIHGIVFRHIKGSGQAMMFRWPPGEYRAKPFVVTTAKVLEAEKRIHSIPALELAFEVQGWPALKKRPGAQQPR
jgi:hypothetical protein